ncbi:GPI mannosyltransferase 3 [Pseudohyphozyma bogoriensis]|nr:GPI mannosyltransferase 3 [Pseudohyphozyma bogoriensis]
MARSWTWLFLVALAVRLANALLTRTFFQPDEFWQSLEVAHRLVFGYGYKTWEWRVVDGSGGIRSPLYPLLFVPVYWVLKVLKLESFVTLAPKLFQAVIAASTDLSTSILAARLYGPRLSNVALLTSLLSFFNGYALARTFSNSMETALTTAALALWPWDGMAASTNYHDKRGIIKSSLSGALVLAAIASVLRPSNIIIWMVLGAHLLFASVNKPCRLRIVSTAAVVGISAAALCLTVDSWFYGTLTFTPYTFLVQNVLNSISLFYGANPFHFYLTQALPVTTMTMLPFVLHGLYLSFRDTNNHKARLARTVVFATAGLYSLLGHKEWRFIHPLLPILHVFAANSLVFLAPPSQPTSASSIPIRTRHLGFLLLAVPPIIFVSSFHCVAQVSIMDYLRHLPSTEFKSVAFLMPCHSTPWQSHLHRADLEVPGGGSGEGGRAWFIGCEPPVLGQDPVTYRDQTNIFYDSPIRYLQDRFPPLVDPSFPPSPFTFPSSSTKTVEYPNDLGWRHTWPSHVVVFDVLLRDEGVQELLGCSGAQVEWVTLGRKDAKK